MGKSSQFTTLWPQMKQSELFVHLLDWASDHIVYKSIFELV